MKIAIINGSARKGNTLTAINSFIKGASEGNEIEVINPDKLNIAPCKGCGACQCHKGCVDKPDHRQGRSSRYDPFCNTGLLVGNHSTDQTGYRQMLLPWHADEREKSRYHCYWRCSGRG